GIAQHIVRLGVMRIARNGLGQRSDGLVVLPLAKGMYASFKICLGFMGGERHGTRECHTPEQPPQDGSTHNFLSTRRSLAIRMASCPCKATDPTAVCQFLSVFSAVPWLSRTPTICSQGGSGYGFPAMRRPNLRMTP